MRIYEFSKAHNIAVSEIKKALVDAGFEAKSHMSVLKEDELEALDKKFLKKSKTAMQTQAQKTVSSIEKKEKTVKLQEQPQKVEPKKVVPEIKKTVEKPSPFEKKIDRTDALKITPKQDVLPAKEIKKTEPLATKPTFKQPKTALVVEPEKPIAIPLKAMTVGDFADLAQKLSSDVILTLIRMGVIANKNQLISSDVVQKLIEHYELEIASKEVKTAQEIESKDAIRRENQIDRHPVVVVIGHVDHGKTTLLDYIRKTKVASREKGGITQHLGAYEATTPHGKIVFLDTPGHEAFAKIRQRGIRVADIAILVVAADDGVMPQTIEAINFAKRMNTVIVVAITKVDKVDKQRLEVIKRELSQYDLLPEEWGGNIICVPVSGVTGEGVDKLLEMVLLQSQMMDLKTSLEGNAHGYVLEARLDKGRGPVATILTREGTLKVGDYFICGITVGRVTGIIDTYGKRLESADPTTPVLVSGFESLAQTGDAFNVVPKNEYLIARIRGVQSKDDIPERARGAQEGAINLIVKADNKSSQEAIVDAIGKMSSKSKIGFNIISSGVGNVSERDVDLAADTHSRIIAFHVKPEINAQALSQRRSVAIETYDIIYRLIEKLEEDLKKSAPIAMVRKKVAEAVVRAVFDIKNVGVIAGSFVKDGKCPKDAIVVGFRNNKKFGEGKIKSLQRDKKAVKEVHAGFECGFLVEGMNDWQVDDRIECYIEVPKNEQ